MVCVELDDRVAAGVASHPALHRRRDRAIVLAEDVRARERFKGGAILVRNGDPVGGPRPARTRPRTRAS
jgi:hypothetical protein